MKYAAAIPCHNAEDSIEEAVGSLFRQGTPPERVLVVDDGSTDRSAAIARSAGAEVLSLPGNLGRGAARAAALRALGGEFTLFLDATNRLDVNFAAGALRWMQDDKVAAVFGRVADPHPEGVTARWRARHLFRQHVVLGIRRRSPLITTAVLLRTEAVASVGGFDEALRHGEDFELGERLLPGGWDIVFDPSLGIIPVRRNTLPQVLERYWRWNVGRQECFSAGRYARAVVDSVRLLSLQDLRDRDLPAALISLLCPHYWLWRSLRGNINPVDQLPGNT